MKIYIVQSGEYSDRHIVGAFTDPVTADAFMLQQSESSFVEGWEADVEKPVPPTERICWYVHIVDVKGEIRTTSASRHGKTIPAWDRGNYTNRGRARVYGDRRETDHYVLAPFDDEERALKIALEQRAIQLALK